MIQPEAEKMEKYDVIIYGCGVMGRKTAQALLKKESLEVVGALNIDPEFVGKDLGEVLDIPEKLGIVIEKDPVPFFLELC
jgi:hypothetical protein